MTGSINRRRFGWRSERGSSRRWREAAHRLRALLAHASEACAVLDAEGVVSPERTSLFDEWFGCPSVGATLWDHFSERAPDFAARSRLAWAQVQEGVVPGFVSLEQMPSRLTLQGSVYQLNYSAIDASEPPKNVLVVASDISSNAVHEGAERRAHELTRFVTRAVKDRASTRTFLQETERILGLLDRPDRAGDIARGLHTLKGNAAGFGLESIAEQAHELESLLRQGVLPLATVGRLRSSWNEFATAVAPVVGSDERSTPMSELMGLVAAIRRREPTVVLVDRVRALSLEPVAIRLDALAEQAYSVARSLGKAIQVTVESNGVRLDPSRWGPLFSALIHAIRNAVDHGIEAANERVRLGKLVEGKILLRVAAHGRELVVEVADDGSGIDVSKLVTRATSAGFSIPTNPLDLVFEDGLSTASGLTHVSGRGVGMSAVAQAVEPLGGVARVESVPGSGTTLVLSFPDALSDDEIVANTLPPLVGDDAVGS